MFQTSHRKIIDMRTKYFLTGLIISLVVITSCEKEKAIALDNFSITYSKGSSWVDYSYDLTIDQNGLMQVVEVNGLTEFNRTSDYHLGDSDLGVIKEKLSDLVKIDISDQYGFDNESAPTDFPVTKLIYKTMNKTDSTVIYYPKENELPIQVDSFMVALEQIILGKDTLIDNE